MKESVLALACATAFRTVDTVPKRSIVVLRRCAGQVAGIRVSVNGIASVSRFNDDSIIFIEETGRATIGASLTCSSIAIIELVRSAGFIAEVV